MRTPVLSRRSVHLRGVLSSNDQTENVTPRIGRRLAAVGVVGVLALALSVVGLAGKRITFTVKPLSREALEAKLESINASIDAHPLSSEKVKRANVIVEAHDSGDVEAISRELAEQGLPDLIELGKITSRSMTSLAYLFYQRRKLTEKLERLAA